MSSCRTTLGGNAGKSLLRCSLIVLVAGPALLAGSRGAGAEVRQGDMAALTWDVARMYHLIIAVNELPPKRAGGPAEALARFVRAGGFF